MWEYRKASSVTADYPPLDDSVRVAYFRIIKRLDGKPPEPAVPTAVDPEQRVDRAATSALAARLLDVSTMDPQARGYAFEKFLKDVFDAYGMSARASFRLTGEQIDGSFMLGEPTYLLEARWRNAKVDVETLRAFNAKVEEKRAGPVGLSSAKAASHRTDFTCLDAARVSYAWMDSICTTSCPGGFIWLK